MKTQEYKNLIDGKRISKEILSEVNEESARFSRDNAPPKLTVLIAGDEPASQVYVGMKVKASAKCNIDSDLIELPADITEEYLIERLRTLNSDRSVDGILVQLPLPAHIDEQKIIESISPDKDVDGFHPYNLGRLVSGKRRFVPCTPLGIMTLLERYSIKTEGSNIVVVGRSLIVGKPMALLLSARSSGGNATVTLCHTRTRNLEEILSKAEIIIAAAGSPRMITGEMVSDGVVVIDVGMNRVDDPAAKRGYRLDGDVDFDSVQPKASLITPVPGGVGPMTVATLMKNTLQAAKWARGAGDEIK
ncbi:MAG: bifunctional 5,10-methylenetetrahydrofolate dehydrogenase/5,10-methenyltetrahydrofolate cyclohydrolase [Candidatus Krumholzibacteriota bacterium]|nr:bifunctional 5,10-methylenetetrahydrofolate dehydrogenase/5,10-methenyltetrahydrofolate cyclohydrolase [Candidatus Krumholzibacteriota bacterium]